ncbi:MAG TPA: DUF3536 domain-containing protein [Candidatus Limnocylindrales bacterium]
MTSTPRGRLVVHAHFHQPDREDPFTGEVPGELSASPFHDWMARVDAECYRPNAERGNFAGISFDVGPLLAGWLSANDPSTAAAIVAADAGRPGGNAMALPYHHTILPLASMAERRTEIRWGLRAFEVSYGRAATGMWLPETAVDLPTLRLLADEGVAFTVLAPWQTAEHHLDTRRPYRVELGDERTMTVVFYDAGISGSVSFDQATTSDADRFARDSVLPRLAGTPFADGTPGLVLVATDGELYGHHQKFRDLFLQHLVAPGPNERDRGFDIVGLAEAIEASPQPFPAARIRERTSWSCHHGVARWGWECPDAHDGRWKAPLRAALTRLATAVDAAAGRRLAEAGVELGPARDAYVDVVLGVVPAEAFVARLATASGAGPAATAGTAGTAATKLPAGIDAATILDLLEAERWRLAMFASDAWFWEDPIRPETKEVLRFAARAARLVDRRAGTRLEEAFIEDLHLFHSPSAHLDGAAIYGIALEEVGEAGVPIG